MSGTRPAEPLVEESQPQAPDVFISYARADGEFVGRFAAALSARGKDVWVDVDDIPATAEWMAEIERGIDAAGAFAFVISPASLTSEMCAAELARAVESGKRLVPLLRRDPAGASVPPALASREWIVLRDDEGFDDVVAATVRTLETDLEWVQVHTRLLVRAREWEASGKDGSLLLRGSELRKSDAGLDAAAGAEPAPTTLQLGFVRASRSAAVRRQRSLLGAVAAALVVTLVLAGFALLQRSSAISNERTSRARELVAYASQQLSQDPEASVLLAQQAVAIRALPEAVAALRAAIEASFVRAVLDRDSEVSMERAAVSPDGNRVLTGGSDGNARLWQLRPRRRVAVLPGPPAGLLAVGFAGRGSRALTLESEGSLTVWQAASGKRLGSRQAPFGRVPMAVSADNEGPLLVDAAFGAGGSEVIAATGSGAAAVWALGPPGRLVVLRRPGKVAEFVAFASAAQRAAVTYTDGTVIVWDTAKGKPVGELRTGSQNTVMVALSPDGTRAANGLGDGTVQIWDVGSSHEVAVLRGFQGAVDAVGFGVGGSLLAAAAADGTVRVWRLGTAEPLAVYRGHTDRIYAVAFDPAGSSVVTASNDGTTRTWAVPASRGTAVFAPSRQVFSNVAFSADGRVAATATMSGLVRVRVVQGGKTSTLRVPRHRGNIVDVELSRDGTRVLAIDGFGGLFLGEVASRRFTVARSPDYVESAELDPDASSVVTVAAGRVLIRGLRDGKVTSAFRGGGTALTAAFDSHGKQVVSGEEVGGARVYEVGRAAPVAVLASEHGRLATRVLAVAFSPDGRRTVVGDEGGTARVWVVGSRTVAAVLDPPGGAAMHAVAFSADGELVATGDDKGTVRVWLVAARQELARFSTGNVLQHIVYRVAFAEDGRAVMAGADDGSARLFVCDACAPVAQLLSVARQRVTRTLTPREREVYLHQPVADR